MTRQEMFDIVSKHLLTQMTPSKVTYLDGVKGCAYRGDGGLMCAIGCLIPDSVYTSKMEGNDVEGLIQDFDIPGLEEKDVDFLCDLQNIHDNEQPDTWERELRATAAAYNLEFNA